MGREKYRWTDSLWKSPVVIFTIACLLALEMFLIRGVYGLNLADEGFLWYGVDRVFHGDVPVRDFRAYDPFRYYWSALWFHLWRPGLIPLRFSETVAQAIGLFFGMLAFHKIVRNIWETAIVGFVLLFWMHASYHYLDICIPMIAVYVGYRLVESPKTLWLFLSGVFVGLSAFVQRQHGLYLSISFVALILSVFWGTGKIKKAVAFWSAGVLTGFLPMLWMLMFVKGFAASYWDSMILLFIKWGATNLHLPINWPWSGGYSSGNLLGGVVDLIFRCMFPIVIVFYAVSIFKLFRGSRTGESLPHEKLLLVCVAVGIPYLHYFLSRADFEHLTNTMAPFWIGFFAQYAMRPNWRRAALALGVILTLFSAAFLSGFYNYLDGKKNMPFECGVGQDKIMLDAGTAYMVEKSRAVAESLRPGESLLVLPRWTTLYPALGLKSPTWDTFMSLSVADAYQMRMIREMEKNNVRFVIIDNSPLDGKDELRFSNTQKVLWDHLVRHFNVITDFYWGRDTFLLSRRGGWVMPAVDKSP